MSLCAEAAAAGNLDLAEADTKEARLALARILSNTLIEDVLLATAARIGQAEVKSADDVRRYPGLLVGYSEAMEAKTKQLRKFLYANLYFHRDVNGANQRACEMMAAVFAAYLQNPGEIGREATRRVPNCGIHRAAGDYIAGMTDRYLLSEHARLFHVS